MEEKMRGGVKENNGEKERLHEVLRVSVQDGVDFAVYGGKNKEIFVNFEKDGKVLVAPVDLVLKTSEEQKIKVWDSAGGFDGDFERGVSVILDKMRDPRVIFTFLHELGHIEVWRRRERDDPKMAMLYSFLVRKIHDEYGPQDYELDVQDERDAWAAGLRMARKLREKYGIDLFKLFKNVGELMGWLRVDQLETYENELRARGGKMKNEQTDKVHSWLQTRWEEEVLGRLEQDVRDNLT